MQGILFFYKSNVKLQSYSLIVDQTHGTTHNVKNIMTSTGYLLKHWVEREKFLLMSSYGQEDSLTLSCP